MKKTKFIYITFFALATILLNHCSTIPPLEKSRAENFTKNGFLDENHFQVIVKTKPDRKSRGLVNQRTSSITKARNQLQGEVINRLMDYYLLNKNLDKELKENKILYNRIYKILSYGSTMSEFFDKKNNAYIIYRIKKIDLKNYLLEIKL